MKWRLWLACVVASLELAVMSVRAEVLKPLVPDGMLEDFDAGGMEDDLWVKISKEEYMSKRSEQLGQTISLALWDAKLVQVYVRLSAVLSAVDAQALVQEQLAWTKERNAMAEDDDSSEEGVIVCSSMVDLTKKRVAELKARLEKVAPEKAK